jgi:hypothetical protein
MAAGIDDEILHTFAAVGSPAAVAEQLQHRFGDVVDRLGFATQDGSAVPPSLLTELRRAQPGG